MKGKFEMNKVELQIYVHAQQPYWEILAGNTRAAEGLYRFVLSEDVIKIQRHTNVGWVLDGTASWEFVEKIVNAYKAGKRGCDLGQNLHRKERGAGWY